MDVSGIGLSGQAHGFVLIGSDDQPLRPAILWTDLRTTKEVTDVLAFPEESRSSLCNPITVGMAGPGILWVQRNEPEIWQKTRKALAAKDWLKLKLTGEISTEPSDASMTCMYDVVADCWSTDIMTRMGLESDVLPQIGKSASCAGTLRKSVAETLGLPAGIPISGGLADSASCLLGMGISKPGDTILQIGSGIQIMTVVDEPTPEIQPFYNTFRAIDGLVYKMAAMQNGGTAFEWVREVLGANWDDMYRAAFDPNPGHGNIMFLPYACGERAPILDPHAAASFTNMHIGSTRENLIRSIFEGVALAIRDSWDALAKTGVEANEFLVTGGGSRDIRWRQLIADIVRVDLIRSSASADATKGAAYLGGLAAGYWASYEDLPVDSSTGETVRSCKTDVYADRLTEFRRTYSALRVIP
jgi:xylulokinase